MSNLLPFSFIKEKINSEFDFLDKEKVTAYLMAAASNKGSVELFDGTKISPSNMEFSGSPRLVFWQRLIQPFLKDIISRIFKETRGFSTEHNLQHSDMLSEANKMLKMRIEKIFSRMVDIDRRLRGKGFPDSVKAYNARDELSEMLKFLDERYHAELAIIPKTDKQNELKPKPPELLQNFEWIRLNWRPYKVPIFSISILLVGAWALKTYYTPNFPKQQNVDIVQGQTDKENLRKAELDSAISAPKNQIEDVEEDPVFEILKVSSNERIYVSQSREDIIKSISGVNDLQKKENFNRLYKGKWIRVKGSADISKSSGVVCVNFTLWYKSGLVVLGPFTFVQFGMEESEHDKIAHLPNDTMLIVEGQLDHHSINFTKIGLINGRVIEVL